MIPKIALTYKWEKETLDYLKLPGVTLSFAQTITLDDQIKIIKGGGTITLLAQSVNISKINGLAFLTNPSTDMRKFKGFKLSVKAAGKTLVGWVKTVGTGETLGANGITSTTNGGPNAYETLTLNANGYDIDSAVNTAGDGLVYTNPFWTLGRLYKNIVNLTLNSGTAPKLYAQRGIGSVNDIILDPVSSGSQTVYWTARSNVADQNGLVLFNILTTTDYALTWDSKQVLTPSALGCTIVSTIEGAVQSWTSDDGINPNSLTFDIDITNS